MRNSFREELINVDGPICGDALRASGTQLDLSNNPRGLGNPQETFP